jgi:hypothetical protein
MTAATNSPAQKAPEYKEAERQKPEAPVAAPIVPTPQARAGVTGHNARYVLGFGIAAVVIAFVIIYLIYAG